MADIYPKPEPSRETEPEWEPEGEETGLEESLPDPERQLPEPDETTEQIPPPGLVESETAAEKAAEAEAAQGEPTPEDIGPQPSPEPRPVPPPLPETEPGMGGEYRTEAMHAKEEEKKSQSYTVPPAPAPQPLSPQDERLWAMLSHLSVLLNLVTGFLGPIAALLIYLIYKDRSKYVAFQSMQAFVFQMVWWIGGGILAAITWTLGGLLLVILVGCLLFPLALLFTLMPLVALVYGVVGAVETNQGRDFRYWLIGDWVRDMMRS